MSFARYEKRFGVRKKRKSPRRHTRRKHERRTEYGVMDISTAIVGSGIGIAKGSYSYLKKRREEGEEKRKENEQKERHKRYLEVQEKASRERVERMERERKKEMPEHAESKSNLKQLALETPREKKEKGFNPFRKKKEIIEA